MTLNGIGGQTLPFTSAGILTHVTPQNKLIKFLCYVFDTPIGSTGFPRNEFWNIRYVDNDHEGIPRNSLRI